MSQKRSETIFSPIDFISIFLRKIKSYFGNKIDLNPHQYWIIGV